PGSASSPTTPEPSSVDEPSPYARSRNADKQTQTQQSWKDLSNTTSNWALVFVGIMGTCIALKTLKAVHTQAIATKWSAKAADKFANALFAIERAWIIVSIRPYHVSTHKEVQTIGIDITNHGKTPAFVISISTRFRPIGNGWEQLPEKRTYESWEVTTYGDNEAAEPWSPGACRPFEVQLEDSVITPEQAAAIEKGTLWLIVFGTILYRDV